MRIFMAVRHALDPKIFYGGLWSANFYPALRELGHEIVESQTDLAPASRFMDVPGQFTQQELQVRARVTESILAEVSAALGHGPIDLFISYFYNAHFDPAGFAELRRLGIPSINFYCNSIYQFELVASIAAAADFSWHPERDARASYLSAGARPICVQMAAAPEMYYPVDGVSRRSTACFVGQRYADRDVWMAALIKAGVPVEIYGAGWGAPGETPQADDREAGEYLGRPRYRPGSVGAYAKIVRDVIAHDGVVDGLRRLGDRVNQRRESGALQSLFQPYAKGPVAPGRIPETFSQSEVCLNFSNVWSDGRPGSRLIPHVRLRDFEGPMCRTCYLTGDSDEIAEFYAIGREIDTYSTTEELVEKTRYYLDHPDAAERLRDAGYKRARADHTWRRRFETLFAQAGLPASN
jgi:hypothetical protein